MSATQLGLFDGDEPALDPTFATAHRIQLDATSWIEHVPGWLTGSDALFELLLATPEWERRERWMYDKKVLEPRLTAEYRDITAAPAQLRPIAAALSAHYGVRYDGLWINQYRDHRDSTGWHGDRPTCKRELCTVPVLSLGAPRRFLIRPIAGGTSTGFTPGPGDLIVMGGRAQLDWRHMVPKQTRPAGTRISVNFSATEQATR